VTLAARPAPSEKDNMLLRLPLALAACLSLALPACLLDAGPYEGATDFTASTTGTGGDTSQAGGGAGGDTSSGGTTTGTGGSTAGAGGTGGSTAGAGGAGGTGGALEVPGDICPGKADSISVYANLLIDQGDTTLAGDDYGGDCGGGDAGDIVHAIRALGKGLLTITLEPDATFAAFLQVRKACDDPNSEVDCGGAVTLSVEKDQVVYVIVDGHAQDPNGLTATGKYKLHLYLDGCGNGTIEEPQEECDDANSVAADTCDQCKIRCTAEGSISSNNDLYLHPTTHHCYMQSYDPDSNWQTAANDCAAWGGYLAALATQQEIDDLGGLRGNTIQDIWIGGTDAAADGTFVWINGEDWTYPGGAAPWASNEPNGGAGESCVEIYKNGKLNDAGCGDTQNWLCERSPAGMPFVPGN